MRLRPVRWPSAVGRKDAGERDQTHVTPLSWLSRVPNGRRIGILYSTEHQAEAIRQSLLDTGLQEVIHYGSVLDPASRR